MLLLVLLLFIPLPSNLLHLVPRLLLLFLLLLCVPPCIAACEEVLHQPCFIQGAQGGALSHSSRTPPLMSQGFRRQQRPQAHVAVRMELDGACSQDEQKHGLMTKKR
jgi:hypothetical protein